MTAPTYLVDDRLKEWATVKQGKYIDAINKHRSMRKAARECGVHYNAVRDALASAKKKAAIFGYSPQHDMTKTVPEPYFVKGVSTYYNKEGKPSGQWVKSALDAEQAKAAIEAALAALLEDTPRLPPIAAPKASEAHLCNVYTLTDCHVGMRAWGKEAGADWDLDIAERTLTAAFSQMVRSSPKAGTGIVAQLGDWLHFDSLSAITPASGHLLDADSRFSKVVAAAVRILRRVIDEALQHHKRVVVLMAEGNHDTASAIWLRHMFALLYEREPRVSVIDSELPYYVWQHGDTMIAWHHGHIRKPDELPSIFAAQFAQMWGSTTRRYCHTGHLHHVHEREHRGMTVIQHPTIAARDAYAARGGWIADRAVSAITYHATYGQVGRVTVVPEMLEA
jgi:hypothetical protein